MRERLRPDWNQRVYKFWVKPGEELPQWFWDEAKRMRDLWNDLVHYRNGILDETKDMEKAARKEKWAGFFDNCKVIIKKAKLNWEASGEIFDRFTSAHKKAMKKGFHLHKQHGLESFLFIHRYTGGGEDVGHIFKNTGWRFNINPVSGENYQRNNNDARRRRITFGKFGFSKTQTIDFTTVLSRQIPERAIIKRVALSGKFVRRPPESALRRTKHVPMDGWERSLLISCEIPPTPNTREDNAVCGLDLGWRIMAEGAYLRIGMISDSYGRHIELRLPLFPYDSHYRRKFKDHIKHGEIIYDSWPALIELDSRIGHGVEICKEHIKPLLHSDWTKGFVKMRQGGLRRLLYQLKEDGHNSEQAIEVLSAWDTLNAKLEYIKLRQTQKLLRRRTALYRQIANWITKTYRVISWEAKLNLKELAEEENMAPAIKNAAKYRQFACLSQLRQYIQEAAVKNHCHVFPGTLFNSTRACPQCGEISPSPGSSLFIICPNGHRYEVDYGASDNLLLEFNQAISGAFYEDFSHKDILVYRHPHDPLLVPPDIKRSVVLL